MVSGLSVRGELRQIITLYFLTYAARGLVLPFVNLYLKTVGFSGIEIGLLVSISAFVQLSLSPILNTLADRTGRHRQLFYGFVLGNISALFGIVASTNKLWLSGAVLLRDTTDRPTEPLLSQLTITWLTQHNRKIYGRLRAWGSLGWAVATLLSGRIFAVGGYALLFLLGALASLAASLFVKALPPRTAEPQNQSDGGSTVPRTFGFYVLLASLFLFFVGQGAAYTFMFIFFQDNLGASTDMIGVLAAVAALSEIPSMLFIDALLRRINLHATLIVGMLGMTLLWVVFAALTSSMLLLPLMVVRGTFYTFQVVSITLLVSQISHPANVATNQSLVQVTIPALAMLLTGPVGGWVFDHMGPRSLFILVGIIGMSAVLLLILGRHHLLARSPHADALPEQS